MRLRKRIAGSEQRPRLTVYRSQAHIYVQVIDDLTGKTRGNNKAGAEFIGQTIAQRLKDKGITKVVFDRNGYLYHGRIQAVADAARKAGLEF